MQNFKIANYGVITSAILLALSGCKIAEVGPGKSAQENPSQPPVSSEPSQAPALIAHYPFNEENGIAITTEAVNAAEVNIENQFGQPERVAGIEGNALRTDGFSTFMNAPLAVPETESMTVQLWVALESYPSDAEVPYDQQTPSALISQFDGENGFTLDLNTWGELFFRVAIGNDVKTLKLPGIMPLYQWAHVAAIVDDNAGEMRLYLNGELAATESIAEDIGIRFADVPLTIGKSHTDKMQGIFLLNGLNAAIDEVKIHTGVVESSDIVASWQAGPDNQTANETAIATPSSRFAGDHLRPRSRAMPPANWTNEPHGLVAFGDTFHMFYQRTPNGPYKTQTHWGQLTSPDLINWNVQPDPLYPTLEEGETSGFDMKGIWAGDAVVADGQLYALYTNVNHAGPFNPGIAVATSTDGEDWQKLGPVLDTAQVEDFRDPYLWQEGDTWHMLIGARMSGRAGLAYYTSADLMSWVYEPTFSSVSFAQMDIGSAIWELPVFEPIGQDKHILVVNPVGDRVSKNSPDNPTRAVYWTGEWRDGVFTPDYFTPKNLDVIHGHLSPTVVRKDDVLHAIGIVDERRSSLAQLNAGWTQTFSLPREWYLLDDGQTLGQRAADETQQLRVDETRIEVAELRGEGIVSTSISGRANEVIINLDTAQTTALSYGIEVFADPERQEYTRLYFNRDTAELVLDKSVSSLSASVEDKLALTRSFDVDAFGQPQKFHVFIDHSVVDVFINDKAALSFRVYPTKLGSTEVNLLALDGMVHATNIEAWQLKNVSGADDFDANKIVMPAPPADEDSKNVTIPEGAFAQVIGDFNNAVTMLDDGWIATGSFAAPATAEAWQGTTRADNPAAAVIGSGAVSTCEMNGNSEGCDAPTGTLTSPAFDVVEQRPRLNFLMSGGNGSAPVGLKVYLQSDDSEVASFTPDSCSPSHIDSDEDWQSVDLSAYVGQSVYVEIFDNEPGGCGFLSFDHLHMGASAP